MLHFNDRKFAEFDPELFNKLPTEIHGFYAMNPFGVHLYDRDGEIKAYICSNPRQGYFPVTASRRSDGRVWYMQTTTTATEKWLGLENLGYLATHDAVCSMYCQTSPVKAQALTVH